MAAMTPSTVLVPVQPVFTESERLALAGFLAGYRGLTREAYTFDLRQFTSWCRTRAPCRYSRSAAPTSRPSPANVDSLAYVSDWLLATARATGNGAP